MANEKPKPPKPLYADHPAVAELKLDPKDVASITTLHHPEDGKKVAHVVKLRDGSKYVAGDKSVPDAITKAVKSKKPDIAELTPDHSVPTAEQNKAKKDADEKAAKEKADADAKAKKDADKK